MKKNLIKNYGNKTNKGKLIALIVKAVTGVVGTATIMNDYKIASLIVLGLGAVANEIINFYNWNEEGR